MADPITKDDMRALLKAQSEDIVNGLLPHIKNLNSHLMGIEGALDRLTQILSVSTRDTNQ